MGLWRYVMSLDHLQAALIAVLDLDHFDQYLMNFYRVKQDGSGQSIILL